jgi:hypothetical protein
MTAGRSDVEDTWRSALRGAVRLTALLCGGLLGFLVLPLVIVDVVTMKFPRGTLWLVLHVVWGFGLLCVLLRVLSDLRRRGYRAYWAVPVLTPLTATAIWTILYWYRHHSFAPDSSDGLLEVMYSSALFLAIVIGAAGLAAALTIVVVSWLPTWQIRTAGPRRSRFPWRAVAILGVIYPVAIIALGAAGGKTEAGIKAAVSSLGSICYLWYIVRRTRLPSLADVRREDPRPPVLYVRSFATESAIFAETAWKELNRYLSTLSISSSRGHRRGVTFEEFFSRAATAAIGPFVTLGNPEDYLAREGAARVYADDAGWQAVFHDLARAATLILFEPDLSEGLASELAWLRTSGDCHKLRLITRPRVKTGWRNARIIYVRAVFRAAAQLCGQPFDPAPWPDVVAHLRSLGYSVDLPDPGPGSVVGFDSEGRAILLTSGAETPAQYLDRITPSCGESQPA